jgi:hypothetical protein
LEFFGIQLDTKRIYPKAKPGHPTHMHGLGLSPHTGPTAHKPPALLPPFFSVIVFAAHTLALLYFFATEICYLKNVFAKK